jgi:hypothetical protein
MSLTIVVTLAMLAGTTTANPVANADRCSPASRACGAIAATINAVAVAIQVVAIQAAVAAIVVAAVVEFMVPLLSTPGKRLKTTWTAILVTNCMKAKPLSNRTFPVSR